MSIVYEAEDIEIFGDGKYKWFKKFLDLENGIPSHDTFARVFTRIDPNQLPHPKTVG